MSSRPLYFVWSGEVYSRISVVNSPAWYGSVWSSLAATYLHTQPSYVGVAETIAVLWLGLSLECQA